MTSTLTDTADVLYAEDARGADAAVMARCASFDYVNQEWRDSSDHAHYVTDAGELLFCGADAVTCLGAYVGSHRS